MKNQFLKLTLGLAVIALTFNSCSKKSTDDPNPNPTPSITAVPSTFTQKVMIEESTGAWCGWCVLGADGIKTADEAYPGRVNAVALHGGSSTEPMLVPEYATINAFCSVTGVPHYQLNRGIGGGFPGAFSTNVATALAKTASCGIAIDAKASSGSNVSFTLHAGFNSALTGDYRLIVYLVEETVQNSASSYNQSNYVSGNSSYTSNYYYSQPNPITNYVHKHVARKLLSASLAGGDQIPAENIAAGKEYVKTYTYTIPSGNTWNPSNLAVVAGIMKYDASAANQVILNSQSVKLGTVKNWD